METHSPDEVREILIRCALETWQEGWISTFPSSVRLGTVKWPGVEIQAPSADTWWGKMYIQHLDAYQETFGEEGTRLFRVDAMMVFNIYGPVGAGLQNQYSLAKVMQDRFIGQYADLENSAILVHKGRVNELGVVEDLWETVSFIGDFTYNEVR